MRDVPIVSAATGYTSYNGMNYIIVFNEALYMGHTDHSLINSDQCRHSGPEFQDNLYNQVYPMTITGPNVGFIACLQSVGTVLFLDTWHPIQKDLESFPHVEMTSRHY